MRRDHLTTMNVLFELRDMKNWVDGATGKEAESVRRQHRFFFNFKGPIELSIEFCDSLNWIMKFDDKAEGADKLNLQHCSVVRYGVDRQISS
jgi:hypothetical protein